MIHGALAMLYASHVIDGKRTIEQVPSSVREQVKEIVEDATKKENGND